MKKREKTLFEKGIVIFALIVAAVLCGILAYTVYFRHGQQQVMEDSEPVGDEESLSYDWKGSYMETMYLETTLSIEGGIGGIYNVTMTWSEAGGDDISIWKCQASFDKAHRALVYNDMVRTNMVIPQDADSESTSEDVYAGGTGFFYLRGGKIYWEDRNEDFGAGLQFEKI